MNVLVADDDCLFRSLLQKFLHAEAAVNAVWEAENGEEAVLMAEERHPDLVIVGLALLRISGLEATRLIKSKHPEMKVVILSEQHDAAYERAALECGADAYYPKSKCRSVLHHIAEGQPTPGPSEDAPMKQPAGYASGGHQGLRRPAMPRPSKKSAAE